MFLSTGLKRVRLLGMGTHFFPKNLARGMLIRVGTFIRDTIVNHKRVHSQGKYFPFTYCDNNFQQRGKLLRVEIFVTK